MNQLLLGASFPFAAGVAYYIARRGRASFRALAALPLLMVISMLWAVAPDLPRLFGYRDLYYRLALDPRCNMFYWHYSIDLSESDSPLYAVGFALIALCMLAAVWREIRISEKS